MTKKIILICFVILVESCLLYSQNPAKAYLKYAKGISQVDIADTVKNNAGDAIGEEWESFPISEGNVRQSKPTLDELPTAVYQHHINGTTIKVSEIVDTIPAIWGPISTDAIIEQIDSEDPSLRSIQFDFYGVGQVVTIPKEYGSFHPNGISEKEVSEFWHKLSGGKYSSIIADCNKYKIALGYNDWAVLKWTQALAEAIYPDNINSEQEIFTVFLLNQMGLRVRAARSDDKLITMFSSLQNVYAKKFIVLETYPYYLVEDLNIKSNVYTYRIDYARTTRPLDLRISSPIMVGDNTNQLKISKYSSVWENTLNMSLPRSLMDFYNDYPQMDAKVYASAVPNQDFIGAFQNVLADSKMGEVDTINQLLSFLHLDFKYMVDQEQFGKEKPFFLEENLLYPYNDCEDRSILLSALLRHLLGKKVVLLDYKDHMATAVCVKEEIKGDYLVLNNDRYYVCDPTYIGSTIGMSMPEYRNKPVTVYVL